MNTKCGHFNIIEGCKDCQEIQNQWYGKLKKKGFDDIEDTHLRLLKKWTGVTDLLDPVKIQEPNMPIQSNWPEPNFQKESDLLNHPNFMSICKSLFNHGNNVIKTTTIMQIWECHCNGASLREIEKQFNIHNATVFRAINRLREMANIMDIKPESTKIIIRDYETSSDAPLVFASWRNCLWFDNHTEQDPPNPGFYRMTTRKINLLLREPSTKVKIACLQDDPDQILGYSAFSHSTLEFVYVKNDYRKQGIATLLTKGFSDIVNPMTKIGKAIADKKNLKVKENSNVKEEEFRRSSNSREDERSRRY